MNEFSVGTGLHRQAAPRSEQLLPSLYTIQIRHGDGGRNVCLGWNANINIVTVQKDDFDATNREIDTLYDHNINDALAKKSEKRTSEEIDKHIDLLKARIARAKYLQEHPIQTEVQMVAGLSEQQPQQVDSFMYGGNGNLLDSENSYWRSDAQDARTIFQNYKSALTLILDGSGKVLLLELAEGITPTIIDLAIATMAFADGTLSQKEITDYARELSRQDIWKTVAPTTGKFLHKSSIFKSEEYKKEAPHIMALAHQIIRTHKSRDKVML